MSTISLNFVLTCEYCPEQYDVFWNEMMVGYMRLRHGNLTVECPDVFDELVYSHKFENCDGNFTNESVRLEHLSLAAQAVFEWLKRNDKTLTEHTGVCYSVV